MNSLDVLQAKRADILRVAALHSGRNVRVFGSVVHGENRPDSDVDFLVNLESGRTIWIPLLSLKRVGAFLTWRVYGRIWKNY